MYGKFNKMPEFYMIFARELKGNVLHYNIDIYRQTFQQCSHRLRNLLHFNEYYRTLGTIYYHVMQLLMLNSCGIKSLKQAYICTRVR